MSKKILMHIVGPSGSGKTSIVDYINDKFDNLVAADIDEFDDKAVKELGYIEKKKNYTDAMLKKLNNKKQEIMDKWILKQSKPIILAGHYTEGDNELNIDTLKKVLLDVPAEVSAYREYKRSLDSNTGEKLKTDDIPARVTNARKDIAFFKQEGYRKMSKHDIIKYLRDIYGYGKHF